MELRLSPFLLAALLSVAGLCWHDVASLAAAALAALVLVLVASATADVTLITERRASQSDAAPSQYNLCAQGGSRRVSMGPGCNRQGRHGRASFQCMRFVCFLLAGMQTASIPV